MNKQDVIRHFGGSQVKVAEALGITKSAVSQWDEVIPEGVAYKVQVMTAGMLRVDPSVYASKADTRPAA
jgi:DNA-binding transcriptional regulator YdaS (Cro superfamily)